jgi:hypothetical protein
MQSTEFLDDEERAAARKRLDSLAPHR